MAAAAATPPAHAPRYPLFRTLAPAVDEGATTTTTCEEGVFEEGPCVDGLGTNPSPPMPVPVLVPGELVRTALVLTRVWVADPL